MNPSELNPAIQQDADVNGDAILAAHVQPPNPRDEAMAAVLNRHRTDRGGEASGSYTTQGTDDAPMLGATPKKQADTGADDDQLAKQLGDDTRETVIDLAALNGKKTRVKIDGVESEVPLDQIIRSYQKDGAADNRLREANEALRRAKEMEDRLAAATRAAPAPAPADQQQNNQASTGQGSAEARKKFLDAMFSGDEEAAAAAFDEAVSAVAGRSAATTPDPNEIVRQALPAIKQQMDIDSALTEFSSKYAAIDADPYLSRRAADIAQQKLSEGMTYRDALMAAGAETNDWVRKVAGVKNDEGTTATTQQMTDRQTRKQSHSESIVNGAAGKVGSQATQPKSRAAVLEEMRATRPH